MKVLSTPNPYSLQGMSEKIHFQSFIHEQSLQSYDLLAQDQLAGSRGRRVGLVQSIAPIVKNPATYAELSREPDNVVATMHSFNSLSSKLVAVPLPLRSFHFAAPFPQSVHDETASLQRFISNRDEKIHAPRETSG